MVTKEKQKTLEVNESKQSESQLLKEDVIVDENSYYLKNQMQILMELIMWN